MLAQLIESDQNQQQQIQQQQARREVDLKLQRQRIQQQQTRYEADLKLQWQQKLELKRQVSELTLSLQESESQISGRQVDRHGWGATAEALRRAMLEVTALQRQAEEKDRLLEDSQHKLSTLEKKLREVTKEVGRPSLTAEALRLTKLEVTALQSRAEEKDRLLEDSQHKLSTLRRSCGRPPKRWTARPSGETAWPRRRAGCSSSTMRS